MPDETLPEARSEDPVTVDSLVADLRELGVEPGGTTLVHGSLSSLGWVSGGAPAVVDALMRVVGADGTLVLPTHSPGNMNPAEMEHPPVPESWYETIREQMPPYRPAITPTRGMGAISECFRSYPGVERSAHPQHSFAAWGANADAIVADHELDHSLGENSPLADVYERDGDVSFLGSTHSTNTSLHLAEYRADLALDERTCQSAVVVDGEREWVEWTDVDFSDQDFPACGEAFEREHPDAVATGSAGVADAKLLGQRAMVDFAESWFERTRD